MYKLKGPKLDIRVTTLLKSELVQSDYIQDPELATIAQSLLALPRKETPVGARRRRYLLETSVPTKSKWISSFRVLSLTAGGMFAVLLVLTVFAVYNSNPSNYRLYSYKKTAERIRVNFAGSAEQKVNLELALTQKRLTEAKQTIATNPGDATLAAKVLTELAEQTETAVASVNKVVQNQTYKPTTEVATQLDALVKDQLALLNTITATPETEPAAIKALSATQQTTKQSENLKKIIAATNDESIVNTEVPPLVISGIITNLDTQKLIVNGSEIFIANDTVIKNSDDEKQPVHLALQNKVTVNAITKDNKLMAKEITVEVASKKDIPKKKEPAVEHKEQPDSTSDTTDPLPESKAQGTFITEDPAPQPTQ